MTKPMSAPGSRITKMLLLGSPQCQSADGAVGGTTSMSDSGKLTNYKYLEKKVVEDLAARWKSRLAVSCRVTTLRSPHLPPPEDEAENAAFVRAVLARELGACPAFTYERISMGTPHLYFDFLAIYVYADDSASGKTSSRKSWWNRFTLSPKNAEEQDSARGTPLDLNEDVARVEEATSSLHHLGFQVVFEGESRRWAVSGGAFGAGTMHCYSALQLSALAEAAARPGQRTPRENKADPVSEFTIPSHFAPYTGPVGADVEGLISELLRIGTADGYLSVNPGGAFNAKCRNVRACQIGETLNEHGGMGLMQLACKRVSSTLGAGRGRELEAAWYGIGDWR